MKLSQSKRKLTPEDVCREYFESQIFEKIIDGNYLSIEFFTDAWANIAAADELFKEIDSSFSDKELIALNVELFGLAWWHHNFAIVNKDNSHPFSKYICDEILFTKRYLMQNGLIDIWNTMAFYNESMFNAKGKWELWDDWARFRDIPSMVREEDKEAHAVIFLEAKIDLFKDILGTEYEGLDSDCSRRLLYRYITADEWQKGIVMSQELALALMRRLGCKLNNEALFVLQSIIVGLYDNASEFINTVKEYGSYESAKKH